MAEERPPREPGTGAEAEAGPVDPVDGPAVEAAARLEREGAWEALGELLEARARHLPPAEAARLELRIGRLHGERTGRHDRAALHLARAARLDPTLVEARDGAVEACLAIRRFSQARRILDVARDGGAERAALAEAYARLAARLSDHALFHDLAMDSIIEAQALDRAAPGLAEARERLTALPRRWRDEVAALEARAGRADRRAAAGLLARAAQLHAAYDPDGTARAIALLEQAWAAAPGAAEVLELVERIHGDRQDHGALGATLDRLAATTRDRAALAGVHLARARLRLVRHADGAGALAALERALEVDPANESAALQALELRVDTGRIAEAVDGLERHLAATPAKGSHAALRVRAAELSRGPLGDPARARRHLEAALRASPGSVEAAAALAPLLADAEEWDRLAEVLALLLAAAPDAAEQVRVRDRLAAVLLQRLDRPREAFEVLAPALALDPRRVQVRLGLEDAARRAGLLPELTSALRAVAGAPGQEPAVRRGLLRRAAEVLDGDLGRAGDAAILWGELAALDPGDREAAAALAACEARARADGAELAGLEAAFADAGEEARREHGVRLARWLGGAGRAERAAEVWRSLRAAAPGDEELLWGLHGALEAIPGREAAAERLELLGRLAAGAGGARRAELELERAGLLADRLDRPGEAAGVLLALVPAGELTGPQRDRLVSQLERLLAAGVDPLRIARALAPLHAARGAPARQAATLERIARLLPEGTDPRERARHLLDAAALRAGRLEDPRGALSVAAAALRACPEHPEARARCEELAHRVGAQGELLVLLVEAADRLAAHPEEELALRRRAAALAEEELGAAEAAAVQLRRCLELRPGDGPLLAALTRVALASERWAEAVELLGARAAGAAGAERAALLGQRADVLRERLGDPAAAVLVYREALAVAPAGSRPRLLARLAEAQGAAGDAAGQAQTLTDLAAATSDPVEAGRASRESARLSAGLGDRAAAIAGFARALAAAPDDAAAAAALEEALGDESPAVVLAAARALAPVHALRGDARGRIRALVAEAGAHPEPAGRAAAWRQVAGLREIELGAPADALAAISEAARATPGDRELRREVRRLADLARDPGAAARLLAELAGALPPGERAPVNRELADWTERRLEARDQATAAWERVLAAEPGDPAALAALRRLHRAAERWPELVAVCEEIARRATSPAARQDPLREIAAIGEGPLGDPARAAAAWAEVVELAPEDREAAATLERLLLLLDRPVALAAALERRLARGEDPDAAFRLAELRRTRLGDAAGAVALHAELARRDPGRHGSVEALIALARAPGPEGRAALAAAEVALRAIGDPARLAAALEARLAVEVDPAERGGLHAALRALHERELRDPDRALAAARRSFVEGGPDRPAAEADLRRLAAAAGELARVAEAYEAAAAGPAAGEGAAGWLRSAARLRGGELGDSPGALADWRALLARAPEDAEALEACERLLAGAEVARERLAVARRRADLAVGADRVPALRHAAAVAREAGEPAAAVELLGEARRLSPRDEEVLAELEGAMAEAGAGVAERAGVLAELADVVAEAEDPRRRELLLRRAALLEGAADPAVPVAAYAALLAEWPRDAAAVEGLERLLGREDARAAAGRLLEDVGRLAGDPARLAALLEIRLEAAAPGSRRPILEEIGGLRERAGDLPGAFAAWLRVFEEAVAAGADAPEARAELERLAGEGAGWAPLAAALEAALGRVAPGVALELRRRLAAIHGDRLGDLERAAALWEAVAGAAPGAEPLQALVRVRRRQGARRELAGALLRLSDATPDDAARIELLFEVAKIMDEQLGDRDGAIEGYRRILAIDPDAPGALRALGKLLGAAERWEELAGVLAREAAAAERRAESSAEGAELRHRLGRVRQVRLADAPGALAEFRAVLARVPRHPGTLAALEELSRGSGAPAVQAAELLIPIFLAEGEHAKVVELLEARVRNEPAAPRRAALLRQEAELLGGAGRDPVAAFHAAGRALAADPEALESLELVVGFGRAAGLGAELAALLADSLDRARDPAVRVEVQRQLARLAGDPARSAAAWERLLDLQPADREAIAGLLEARRGDPDAGALEKALRRALAIEERPAERARLLGDLAALQEERLGDPEGAVGSARRQLELEPGSREALARLDRLLAAGERWGELAEVLVRELELDVAAGERAGASQLRERLAELRETRLGDRDGALDLYREVLRERPEHPVALARVEGILARDPGNAAAARALEAAYAATGDRLRQAAALEARASSRPDPVERRALLVELADLREGPLGDLDGAFLALGRAFREDPADAALRGRLEGLAERSGHLEELAALYEEALDRLPAGELAAVALVLGRLHEAALGEPARAVGFFRRARQVDPAAAPVALPALERLHRRLEAWPELAEVLESEAAAAEGAERVALLFRLGQLAEERLASPERAVAAYQGAVAVDPRHLPSLQALDRLYLEAGRFEELFANLAAQRAATADGAAREALLARQAALADPLGRPEVAVALWGELLGLRPRHEGALAALEELLERLERWPELAQHLRLRLAATVDRREIARLNDKLGSILGSHLGDAAQAIRSYQAVLESDPRNRRALEALRDIHAAAGDLPALAAVLRRLVPLQEEAPGVKRVRIELAEVLQRAGQRIEAVEQAKLAFDIEPHLAADLVRIEDVLRAAGAAADGIRVAEARAALLAAQGGPAEAVPAWLAVAALWSDAHRPDAAAAALERVLELDPSSRPAFERLRELHAAGGNWRACARVCDQFAGQLADPAEALALRKEVARIHEERLGQKEMAFLAWCRALADAPGDEAALAEAGRLARETAAEEELAAVLEQVAEEARGTVKSRLLQALGALRDGALDDADGAEAAYRRALEADPAGAEPIDALARLFERRGRTRDLVITLEQKLEATAGLEEKKALLLEVARRYDRDLHDVDEAIASLRRILELDGGEPRAIEALAALLRRERRWGELAGILGRARDLAADDAARIGWQRQIAALQEQELGDDEGAIEGYRTVLGLDDGDREALAGLERLYTKLDRFAELNRVYERQVQLTGDPAEQVRILARSAAIFEEKMRDLPRAIGRCEAILGIDGTNLPALKALERLYRAQGLFDRLLTVLEHHLGLATDRGEQVALLVDAGEVWWKELARVDRAEAIFSQALALDPESRQAVSALGRLYERSGNWNLALDMLRREARLAGASRDAVDLYVRIGAIQEEMLGDAAAAREAYGKALALDPGCLPAIRALEGIEERAGDRTAYLALLTAEARYAEDDARRAARWTDVGRIEAEERDDREAAARAYEEALKRVPGHLPAARPLSDIYVATQRWSDALRVLEAIVGALEGSGDSRELCRQAYRLGYVSEKLGDRGGALAGYRRAYGLDATYLPALEGLGNLLVAEGQLEEALQIFTAIVIHHRDALSDLEVVEAHWQIGDLAARLGQPERAAGSFRKALEIDRGHEPSRRGLIALHEAAGEWEAAVEQRQRLLPSLEGRPRFEALVAIGEACRTRLQDPYQAIDAYLAASRLDPADLPVTEALLALYRETRQGQKAADVLVGLSSRPEAQADPARLARLQLLLAEILRDEVKDEAGALAALERSLDADPRQPRAFAAVEEILARGKRWPELEQAYVRMIQRLPRTPDVGPVRLALWRTLGDLYRSVLGNDEGARLAFQVVARADPGDAAALEIYADLSARAPGQEAEAVASYRRLLALGARPQKALSALVGLHAAGKAYDRAYCAAQVLAHLVGGASPEELAVAERLRKYAREQASRPLDDALWALLLHERLRGPLAEIMTLLALHAGPMFTQTPKELGLNARREEVDLAGSMLFFVNMFKYVARTLAVEPLRLFRREAVPARLQLVPTDPPALLAAEELFRDRPRKELWFAIGKAAAFRRPELRMARLMPHDQLDLVFQAACSVGTSRFVVTGDPVQVERLKKGLEKVLPEPVRARTLKLLARQYTELQHPGDLRAYLDGAELTSNRVGALLAADLEVARRGIVEEKAQVSKLREESKVEDLSNFCVSEDYAALREKLGLAAIVPTREGT